MALLGVALGDVDSCGENEAQKKSKRRIKLYSMGSQRNFGAAPSSTEKRGGSA